MTVYLKVGTHTEWIKHTKEVYSLPALRINWLVRQSQASEWMNQYIFHMRRIFS